MRNSPVVRSRLTHVSGRLVALTSSLITGWLMACCIEIAPRTAIMMTDGFALPELNAFAVPALALWNGASCLHRFFQRNLVTNRYTCE